MNYAPTFFTDDQKRILKTLWIPALLAFAWVLLMRFVPQSQVGEFGFSRLYGIYIAIFLCWEEVIKRNYQNALIIFASCVAVKVVAVQTNLYLYHNNLGTLARILGGESIYIFEALALLVITAFVTKKNNALKVGLLSGAAYYLWSFMGAEFAYFVEDKIFGMFHQLRMMNLNLTFLVAPSFTSVLFFGWYYISDNLINLPDYRTQLESKIQVISGNEYFILFAVTAMSAWSAIFYTAEKCNRFISIFTNRSSYEAVTLSTFVNIAGGLTMLVVSSQLMRNVIIGRMMTAARSNGWLYMLHFIPVFNIIAWIKLKNAATQHTTREENAVFYLTRERTPVMSFVVLLGIVLSLIGAYALLMATGGSIDRSPYYTLLLVLQLIKIGCYLVMAKQRNAVFVLLGLNAFSALMMMFNPWDTQVAIIQLLTTYLSYFFVMETFHPQLEGDDLTAVPEEYLHTDEAPEPSEA